MRGYVHQKTAAGIECRTSEVSHQDREYVIVCDYAQNLPLPHYGGEQPGEIYYFSALTINLFGIVDLSLSPNKLKCYAYREFTARKGSNNVASLIMQDLYDKFWLRKGSPGKKLTIAMDNCSGQNKNNVVLRLALYLVEMKYFRTVEFVFYIRGHTKNACDRMFNQMKLKYHKQDIFSWSKAIATLGVKEHVLIVDAKESMFKDYGALLDKFYGSFKTNTIRMNHLFKVEDTDVSLSMQCATHVGAEFVSQPMLKKGQVLGQARTDAINAFMLETLKPPGLRPIKQVELFKKFRPFVPRQFWAETCPRPSDEIMLQIKDESAEKRKKKALGKMQAVAPTAADTTKSAAATAKASTVFSKASAKTAKRPAAPKRAAAAAAKASTMAAKRPAAAKPSGKNKKRKAADPVSDTDSDWSE
jgi:hypothetical protein